ncbi:winged helix DNA-binding domain-containing protein [Flindersiella endophytica]
MSPDPISRRGLNRALLDRQYLLARRPASAYDTIEHLAGMQAQLPLDPYVGLWSRLEGFQTGELAKLMLDRQVVRATLMRGTIHLVSARDCLFLRPLLQIVMQRIFTTAFGRPLKHLDLEPMLEAGARLMDEQPRTRTELRKLLGERWPDVDANNLAYAVSYLVPTVQVTPRGVWGQTLQPTLATVEGWLGRPLDAGAELDDLVLRYLAAFGPATVRDVQAWCGLTKLREVVDRLGPRLRRFRDENGAELYDLPEAPRPAAETPAPVRFLPVYDNALLSHADRSRILDPGGGLGTLFSGPDANYGGLLVDGFHTGIWRIDSDKDSARLDIQTARKLSEQERTEVVAEGRRLLEFAEAEAATYDVRFVKA